MLYNLYYLTMDSESIIAIMTMYFSLYGYVYNWIVDFFKAKNENILKIYETIGYLELCIAMASYRESIDNYCRPVFHEKETVDFVDIYHPLIKNPVTNTKSLVSKNIITGANTSGKTTFAKTIALNTVISQSLNIAFAREFYLKEFHVITSIDISDDLLKGDSFYIAEIKRIKYILDLFKENESSLMIVLDEMLKGTNTRERIACASSILYRFYNENCFLFLTTHDIELTSIMGNYYDNYHFREETVDNKMHYDYKLYDGIKVGSNAIRLLETCDFNSEIIDDARKLAMSFDVNGKCIEFEELLNR